MILETAESFWKLVSKEIDFPN